MTLHIVPVNRDQAVAFIADWHRHHTPPVGYRFAVGVASADLLVGVATVGRPVARHYDDGLTVEVTRVATDGTPHACSALYGACWRTAKAMGYRRAITYTHADESGSSLRAAGWLHAATRAARSGWDMPGRRRDNGSYVPVERLLWLVESGAEASVPVLVSRRGNDVQPVDLFTAAGVAA
ncbi:hypothetical protein GCM10011608_09200 [Micromonospora sonchi]|uniref:Uncharacterized protein n=1 Tax=Micromonospora sonchi TaxID=1763543 RepID=A0A917TKM4_9ACTN|nr:XF1762 family protein [Micromonospora sonchi]GGM26574.1 hypothetical protein GCM10011608_09200 [Micromonospora sonchi]